MEGDRFRSNARPRTLLIPCESARGLATAGRARATFALEEAIASRSESCTILPSFEEIPSHSPHAWPYHAPRILGHARFDQAWIWLGRRPFDEIFLAWLASVAPVRIGVLMHPLDYPADAYRRSPHLLAHRSAIEQQLRHLTHVLACDEVDAASCAGRLDLPAMWLPAMVSASDISPAADVTRGPRTAVVIDETPDAVSPLPSPPIVRGLARLDVDAEAGSPDDGGDGFAALQGEQRTLLAMGTVMSADLERYVASRRSIRTDFAQRRARALGQAGIAVTLAPDANAYPIAVLECMAARVPVVCRDIPYRPRNRAMFVPEHHIRLFGIGDQASLARHMRDLGHDPSLAQSQADAALALVQRQHTAERRVEQTFEWLSTGRVPDLTSDEGRVQGHPDHPDHPAANHWRLPASYRRRASPRREGDHASDLTQTITGTGTEGEGHTEAYRVAIALARACGCTRLVDVGCPDPIGLVRASREIKATAICAPHVAQSLQRRCSDVAWHDLGSDMSSLLAGVEGETALIVCAMQFEIDEAPDVLAATLSQFVARARCGLVVSVDRDRTWGPRDAGPPPTPAHLQEWAPAELAGLLRDAGLAVLHQTAIPAGLGRRENACTATIVVHDTTPGDVRDEVRAAAETACETYARQRALLSEYDLVETVADTPPVFVMAPGPAASETPALQVLLGDDRWMALHSGRAPIEEARRWAESVRCEDDRPIVLFGLGLGYHAIALLRARAAPGSRLIVVEPFPDVVARAREIPATREALDHGRIEIVDEWPAFKTLVQARPLPLASICPVSIPVYERVAEEAHAAFSTLLHGLIDWARANLDRESKPFLHPEGMSVVITTFNRVERAAALVSGIARQQPCGVPVEILLVNDHGTTAVFDAARIVAERTGCDLRTFDTYYSGYGPALARNVGLRFARYDTTVFLDDDVEVGSDLLRCYHRAPAGIRMGRIDFLHPDGDRLRQVPDRRIALHGPDRILRPWATFEGFMWSANCAVPTEVALALGGFDEAFLDEGEEDLDFSARTIRATHLPVAVPSALALHHELDLSGGVALQAGRTARAARANERLADPTRGLVVNGGVSYWSGDRWRRYMVT